ncbi:hypothetical protein ACK83A_004829, partial [Salmonella enterica]
KTMHNTLLIKVKITGITKQQGGERSAVTGQQGKKRWRERKENLIIYRGYLSLANINDRLI